MKKIKNSEQDFDTCNEKNILKKTEEKTIPKIPKEQ